MAMEINISRRWLSLNMHRLATVQKDCMVPLVKLHRYSGGDWVPMTELGDEIPPGAGTAGKRYNSAWQTIA